MAKKRDISSPKAGMNRAASPHQLSAGEYLFQKNGNSFDEGGEKYNLTDEHSNILASRYKEGFRYVGGRNHVVRNKTYIFLANPTTGVSEIGIIENTIDIVTVADTEQQSNCTDCPEYTNVEAPPLETTTQTPHQTYVTLLEDSCNFCLGFDVDFPIVDIVIKEEAIGTKLFWTSTPGAKEFRYIELDNLEQYRVIEDDNCVAPPTPTCVDCEKLRVFRLYKELKAENYSRTTGGSLPKGTYEALGAYSDQLGNEFTSYTTLTSPIPIFDESNIIHEQEDNNAVTNFAIKIDLEQPDSRFDYYKIVYRYYTNKGKFTSYVAGIYNTSTKTAIISDLEGQSISNTKLALVKPYVETVDGITTSNNILFLNGLKQREPINLQPVVSLLGATLEWQSYRAKEDLYTIANSYKYLTYNRDEVMGFAMDFGFKQGYRSELSVLVPKPKTLAEGLPMDKNSNDYKSVNETVGVCDQNTRTEVWQFYNTATETGVCQAGVDIPSVVQNENVTTYTTVGSNTIYTEGPLVIGYDYRIDVLNAGDDFANVGFVSVGIVFTAVAETPTVWINLTVVRSITESIPSVPSGSITISQSDLDNFTDLKNFIEDNQGACGVGAPLEDICPFIDLTQLTQFESLPANQEFCSAPVLIDEHIRVEEVIGEVIVETNKKLIDYSRVRPSDQCTVYSDEIDEDFSEQYSLRYLQGTPQIEGSLKKRQGVLYADSCQSAIELFTTTQDTVRNSPATTVIHPYYGIEQSGDNTTIETLLAEGLENKNAHPSTVINYDLSQVGGLNVLMGSAGVFTSKIHKGAVWFKINVTNRQNVLVEISRLLEPGANGYRLDNLAQRFKNRNIRVHFFANCNSLNPISTSSYEDENGITVYNNLGGVYPLSIIPTLIPIDQAIIGAADVQDGFIYMCIDLPFSGAKGLGADKSIADDPVPPIVDTAVTIPLNSCFTVNAREVEISKVEVTYDEILINKVQQYSFDCTYNMPVLGDCEPIPYKHGELGYYQSIDEFPDNNELYNSSTLLINKSRLTNQRLIDSINTYYKDSETVDTITLSTEADYTCDSPLRFYRMPDNKISPFIQSTASASNTDSIISPLGVRLDPEAVRNMLDIAVDNGILTQEQRNDIVDYKIYRTDTTLERSVVASGIVFNTKSYTVENEKIRYFNYPFNSLGKDKYYPENTDEPFDNFQAISPDLDYNRITLPTEMTIQGYMFGKGNMRVVPVEEHSRMVILGRKAKRLADTLAKLEAFAEVVVQANQALANTNSVAGPGSTTVFPGGVIASGIILALQTATALVFNIARYRLEWETTFENLGTPYNFGYYIAGGSNYNYLKPLQTEGDKLRGLEVRKYLGSGMLNVSNTTSGEIIRINNIDRAEAPYFSISKYPIENLNPEYTNFDNTDTAPNFSSQILSSEIGCQEGKSPEQIRNVASPYVAFKNYLANQYKTLDSIQWIDTSYCIDINQSDACSSGILGGDTFIGRHSKKRKTRIFETDLLGSADLTPFPYRFNANYGNPRFYIDYKVNSEFDSGGITFPETFYDVQFDCNTNSNGFYVKPPGKFYLYNIVFTSFLCETRINTNFRNARKEPWNQFYPQNTDYERITQPNEVSLTRPENFYYNPAYNQTSILNSNFILPDFYSRENEAIKAYNPNTVMYSLPDANEQSITEPWLMYRPNDRAVLDSEFGKLINVKGIESDQLLMYFEDALQLQNAVNQFTDGSTQYNSDLGNGGIFAKRAMTLRKTDIGYGGSQSKNTLSCEFGHFHGDLKRGQVFNYTGGDSPLEEISRYSNGKPNGMDVWFKEHLPLRFTRQFPNYSVPDNPYNGVGIHWGYDSKYRRVILTKKDYKVKSGVTIVYDVETNLFNGETFQQQVTLGNFVDISWTMTYRPEMGSWESYMDYKPNYYINHSEYFQSGINSDDSRNGLWSHLLTNKSYRVFYGQKFPYVIEYPIKNEYISKRLEDISWNAILKRYHNEYDYATIETNPFTAVTIYNDYENSGRLIPVENNGTLSQRAKYPITNTNNTQDVLISYNNYRYNVNYFYNRVISNTNNQPMWIWDENRIDKVINPKAQSFYGKKVLERMKGNYFIVRLERDSNTNYDLDFRWSEQTTNQEQ